MSRLWCIATALAGAGLASPAWAECVSEGCYDGIVVFFVSILVYGLLALVVLVMLVRQKWRAAGLKLLGITLAIAIGVPMVSQLWQGWKVFAMERREVVGAPPWIAERVPLLIARDVETCRDNACSAALQGRGNAGLYAVRLQDLEGLDLTKPIAIADLPLERWAAPQGDSMMNRFRRLTPAERARAAGEVDYLIIAARPFYRSTPGLVEDAFRAHPDFSGLRAGEIVKLALAPLEKGSGTLTFAALNFDYLDLWLADAALTVPLGLEEGITDNETVALDVAARALCPRQGNAAEPMCKGALKY